MLGGWAVYVRRLGALLEGEKGRDFHQRINARKGSRWQWREEGRAGSVVVARALGQRCPCWGYWYAGRVQVCVCACTYVCVRTCVCMYFHLQALGRDT